MDIITLALAKRYVQETLEGAGALKGKDGKSAYQVAVDNGFSGTEQEWLNSLQGAQGPAGKDGIPGKDGKDGKDGAPGRDGVDGKDGEPGPAGKDGAQGPEGPQGPEGKQGPQGETGPQGESYVITEADYEEIAARVGGVSDYNVVNENDINSIINGKVSTDGNLTILPVSYYRIEFNELYASNGKTPVSAALTELEFYDIDNNKIIPFFIAADSVYNDSAIYDTSKLIDGKNNTLWSSKDDTNDLHYLEIKFSEPITLSKINIMPRTRLEHGVPNNFTIYASEINGDWSYIIGYFENQKENWIEGSFSEFTLEPYKTDLKTNKKIIDFNGLKQYHLNHGILKANINSPEFTGTPTAVTPDVDDNSNRLATTKFVQSLLKDSCAKIIDKELSKAQHEQRMKEWSRLGLGLFIHWGVYAAWDGKYQGINELGQEVNLNVTNNAEWLMYRAKIPTDVYKTKSENFTGELWNAEEIARMAYQAGMKYIVITAKHHEGFSLFPNENSSWDIDDTPCRDTVLQELKDACDKYGLKFCLYYSQYYDWTEEGGFGKEKSDYLNSDPWTEEQHLSYMEKTINSIQHLVNTFDPYVIWYDIGFPNKKYSDILLEAQELYWPNVIVNDRLASGKQYGDFKTSERIPGTGNDIYSEACFTLNNTWGYNSSNDTLTQYNNMNLETIFKDFIIDSLGKGQNCLLNIGPKPTGAIPTMQKSRLNFMSNFFKKYGILTGGERCNKISYPDWGYMIKTDENTLKCFIYEPSNENTYLYGFDPTYITSVRVYNAENEYSETNYEITNYGIKLNTSLTPYSYDEFITDFNKTISNTANIGVVEIKFNQPIIPLEAKPLNLTNSLSSRCFSIYGTNTKQFNNNLMYLLVNGTSTTEFIWTGETGIFNLRKSISAGTDSNASGKIILTNCTNSAQQIFELNNLASDEIEESVILTNGFRYRIDIIRTSGTSTDKLTFSSIYFEQNFDNITYTDVDHITATKYQYIDTGFAPSNNTKVEVDFMQTVKNSTETGVVIGSESPRFIIATDTTSNQLRFDFGTKKEQTTGSSSYTILNNRYLVSMDKGKCYVNNEPISIDMSNETEFTSTVNIWIGADNGYPQNDVKFLGNIYSVKIWDNDVLVRDFTPVKRDQDGTYGLLDKVNNKFYRSATVDGFTFE